MKKILNVLVLMLLTLSLCCCSNEDDTPVQDVENPDNALVQDDVQTDIPDTPDISDAPSAQENENEPETQPDTEDSQILDITENYEIPGEYEVTLYFPDNDFLYLHPETRTVTVSEGENLVTLTVNELFKGPVGEDLAFALTGEDLVNFVNVSSDGVCTVDFKGDFAILNTGGASGEAFAIGSIVNSVCGLSGIEMVKINIDGNESAEFGHSTLESEFRAMPSLVAH